jgi:hypothetical protein
MVVISIIVALGVAELLAGVARILRGELRFYWVHAIWVLCLLALQFQYCWSLFDLAGKEDWVFVDLMRLVMAPILYFLISSLLFPSRQARGADGQEIDLEQYYYATRKPVFSLLALVMTYFMLRNLHVSGLLFVQSLAIAALAALFLTEDRRWHAGLTVFFALGTVFVVASFSYRLGESGF